MRNTRGNGWAQAFAASHAGAIAFKRTGDPDRGDFGEGEVIAVYGAR